MSRYSDRYSSATNAEIVIAMLVIGVFVSALVTINAAMFDYSLGVIIGKDVPWWLDVIGSLVVSPFLFAVFVLCLILSYCGVPMPLL